MGGIKTKKEIMVQGKTLYNVQNRGRLPVWGSKVLVNGGLADSKRKRVFELNVSLDPRIGCGLYCTQQTRHGRTFVRKFEKWDPLLERVFFGAQD